MINFKIIRDVCNLCESNDIYDFSCVIPEATITNQVLSYLMLLITIISLGTQPISQLYKKTSVGLSAFTWQISILAFWIQTLNMIVTESSKYFAFQNLKYQTFVALIPHFNTYLCVIFCINTIHLYLYYYRKQNGITKHYKQQLLIFIGQILFIAISCIVCVLLSIKYGQCNIGLKVVSYITMIIGCILSCIQEIPQIITTYKQKSGGALSLISQLTQPPANIYTFVLYFFQDVNIISWIQLLVFSVLQTVLCILQVYYDVYLPRKSKNKIMQQTDWKQIIQV